MTPERAREIIDGWGGVMRFSETFDIPYRTINDWVSGRYKMSAGVVALLNLADFVNEEKLQKKYKQRIDK